MTVEVVKALPQLGVATIIVIGLVLIARWYMPIMDKLATAIADNMGDINRNSRTIMLMVASYIKPENLVDMLQAPLPHEERTKERK